jgi:hypothetical protein
VALIEIGIALGIMGAVAGMAALTQLEMMTLIRLGGWFAVLGMALGIPTGLLYHVRLYSALRSRDVLPRDWYWRPVGYHRHLDDTDRTRVMPWFYLGAGGFLFIVLAVVILGFAAARIYFTDPA